MANLQDYATALIATAPSPATSGTSLVVFSGHGVRFPAAPFYATIHPEGQLPTLDNAEKVLVSAKATDTFTIVRAQGGTTAQSVTGSSTYRISNAVFVGDLFNTTIVNNETPGGAINGSNTAFTTATAGYATGSLEVYLNGVHLRSGASNDYQETSTGFTMNTAPATGDTLVVNYKIGSSAFSVGTNSHITDETPTGTVNGSNAVFTTARAYIATSLEVYVNGLKQYRTTDFTETTPGSGTFTFGTAPATGDVVRVNYDFNLNPSSNADTVDGAHASTAPVAGQVPITDANNMVLANIYRNFVINGSCQIAQRAAATLSTTSQYGKVDRFRVHATGTAVSAGSITQNTAAPNGRTGNSLHVSGATITGTGIVLVKHRIESKDALDFKNQVGSFSCNVYQDTGGAINYTITIRKATAVDNFASVTDIGNSGALSVPNAAATVIKLENLSLGDVSNGIEIEISVACGAVTTKNFHFCEFQFNRGAKALTFEPLTFADDLAQSMRYYEKSYNYADAPGSNTANGTHIFPANNNANNIESTGTIMFRVKKRTSPSGTFWDNVGNVSKVTQGATNNAALTGGAFFASMFEGSFWFDFVATAGTSNRYYAQWAVDAEL